MGDTCHVANKNGQVDKDDVAGNRVSAARAALKDAGVPGFSQDAFARRSGLGDRTLLSNIERGRNQLSGIDARTKVARGFGVTLDELSAFLDERMSVEEFVDLVKSRASQPAAVSAPRGSTERVVEYEDPYANRQVFIELLGAQYPSEVIAALLRVRNDEGDLSIDGWEKKADEFKGRLERKLGLPPPEPPPPQSPFDVRPEPDPQRYGVRPVDKKKIDTAKKKAR